MAFLALMVLIGIQQTKAQYLVDFNTTISTLNHDFAVSKNWKHIVHESDYDGYGPYYMSYSYSSSEGINDSGTLLAYRQYAGDYQGGEEVMDILVTPPVSGTVTLYIKASGLASSTNPSWVEFYNVDDSGTTLGSRIQKFTTANLDDSDVAGWKCITLNVSVEKRLGIRAQYVYMDNFSATSATIIDERKLTINSLTSPTGQTPVICYQKEDGSADVSALVTLKNDGDVALVAGDADFTLSFAWNKYYGSAVTVFDDITFSIPEDMAVGTEKTVTATFNVPVDVVNTIFADMNQGYFYLKVKENVSGSTSSAKLQCQFKKYESKFIFDKEGTEYFNSSNATTTPIDFGKISEATTLNYEIYNSGSAPLTINSFILPSPYTSDAPATPFTVAGGEKKVIAITLPYGEPGIFTGNLEINYTNFGKEAATYTLGISGTIIDPAKNLITFSNADNSNGQYPAGSIHSYQVYISSKTEGGVTNYYLQSTSTITKFITPLLSAEAGEAFSFDAWYSSYNSSAAVTVYTSTDRMNWTQIAKETYSTGIGSTMKTFTATIAEAGDYYLAFELAGNALLDNIYGLTLAPIPEHDWYLTEEATVPTTGTQNKDYTTTIKVKNISAEADNLTVTLYMDGEAVASEAVALAGNAMTAAEGTGRPGTYGMSNIDEPNIIELTFKPHTAGTLPAYIELKAGDYVVETDPQEVTISEETITSDLTIGVPSGSDNNSPLNLNYNNSETVSLYNAAKLATYGLKDGDKIQSITYKAYKTAAVHTTIFSAYYEWTDDQTQAQPMEKTAYVTSGMTAIVENDSHTWPQTEGGYGVYEDYLVFAFKEPLVYQEGKSLRLVLRSENDSETNNYASVYFEKGETYGNHYYHRNDSRSDVKITVDGNEVNSKIGVYADWYAGNNPVIYLGLYVEPVNVSGLVTDGKGQPIEGATVTAYNAENNVQYQSTTDSDGQYTINVIQDKLTYVVTATADGYEEASVEGITFTDGSVIQDFTLTEAMPENVTIALTADGTSYSGKWALDFSGLDITAYKATQKNPQSIHCESVTIVPTNTGVIIKGMPGEYQVPTTTEETTDDFSDNLLVANVDEAYTVTTADEGFVYRYVNKEGTAVFQKAVAGQTVSAGKAYLRLTEASALEFIGFDESTTDISLISNPSSFTSEWYTLDGRKLNGAPTQKGVYIINGKKTIVK